MWEEKVVLNLQTVSWNCKKDFIEGSSSKTAFTSSRVPPMKFVPQFEKKTLLFFPLKDVKQLKALKNDKIVISSVTSMWIPRQNNMKKGPSIRDGTQQICHLLKSKAATKSSILYRIWSLPLTRKTNELSNESSRDPLLFLGIGWPLLRFSISLLNDVCWTSLMIMIGCLCRYLVRPHF